MGRARRKQGAQAKAPAPQAEGTTIAADAVPKVDSKKKLKRALKRETLLTRLQSTKAEEEASKKQAQKQKQAKQQIVGDLSEIKDALQLAQVQSASGAASKKKKRGSKNRQTASKAVKSRKARQYTLAAETLQLKRVMMHPIFQNNPANTIHEHLRNVISKEQQEHSQS